MNDQTVYTDTSPSLVPELLLKDDSLVLVNMAAQWQFLKVTVNGKTQYLDIRTPSGPFPADATVADAATLQPFNVVANSFKQVWITVHVPPGTAAGTYTGKITVAPAGKPPQTLAVSVTVLPFTLASSLLGESIYYTGMLTGTPGVDYINKSPAQLTAELADLRDHGILNPTTYQPIATLGSVLEIMKSVGLPTNHLYWLGDSTGNPSSPTGLNSLKTRVANFVSVATAHGFEDPYIYGIDEATGSVLLSERPAWQAVHEAGAKVFVAGYAGTFSSVGDLLDLFNSSGAFSAAEATQWHSAGHQIFSYGDPCSGADPRALPQQLRCPPSAGGIRRSDELYLPGLHFGERQHLEQFRWFQIRGAQFHVSYVHRSG